MKRLKIIQDIEETIQGSIGVLLINDQVLCFTLTPDSMDRYYHLVPGQYKVKKFHGTRFKDTYEIIVPGHTAILFHGGEEEKHTHGCVILGMSVAKIRGIRKLVDWRTAVEKFMAIMGTDEDAELEVVSVP